ncbi:sulfite exporter TauE/SafE family protein [Rubrobacter taiwanensis]|uniref:Probable membrane transporter protein n=1 Tax=Rubrobacter taiwanensis TaxID=185139 RepID=A0A4V2NX55_9ACTN|nr:sulfite exporter TauE/SafE family protein [Rubrobacter taiwanensis]TCJ19902.1 sulfite exporter TauE/SafE family protein [Rubrobacter taiwanensis]
MYFPVSGVEANPLVLLLVAFAVSGLCAPAGVSGAFLLLPFQVSVLGFTSPAVSPTNLIYNVLAAPGGIYRYAADRSISWPLARTIVLGSLPGVFLGAVLRVTVFADPGIFKAFVGLVLLYLGARLLLETFGYPGRSRPGRGGSRGSVLVLAFFVGVVGGIYSIGGGAIIAPFLVAIFRLPVRTVAGAALVGTFVTSVAGIAFFELLEVLGAGGEEPVSPDWLLGAVLGLGGLAGTYAGAYAQRLLPETGIKGVLGVLVCLLAFGYLAGR